MCGAKNRTRSARCVLQKIFWGKDPLFWNARRGYNKKNYSRFEKFSLEEKRFMPIIILAVAQQRVDLWKTICPRVRRDSGNKFTLPTLVIRNYVLGP